VGAETTLFITRTKAKVTIVEQLMRGVDDDLLEAWMDRLLEKRCYNCTIVSDGTEDNDDIAI
jgi:hypothetical protein